MPRADATLAPASLTRFGELLKYLRRRARLTQRELAIEVGYSEAHISRLESFYRPPDEQTLLALFVPALDLQGAPELVARLLALAAAGRAAPGEEPAPAQPAIAPGDLEPPPLPPTGAVPRPGATERLRQRLTNERVVVLSGLAGSGKTTLAAALARAEAARRPVFWLTFTAGSTTGAGLLMQQLARFALAHDQQQARPLLEPEGALAHPLAPDDRLALLGATLTRMAWRAIDNRSSPYAGLPLLCLDNVQLALDDPAVMAVLRQLATTPIALLLISRSSVPLPGATELRLHGLDPDEAQALIGGAHPGLHAALAAELLRKTGGSPMLLRLALSLLDQASDPAQVIAHLEHAPPLATYLIDAVLHQLSPPAARLLTLIALLRQPLNLYDPALLPLLGAAEGFEPLSAALAELQRRQLLGHPAQTALIPLLRDHLAARVAATPAEAERLHELAGQLAERVAGDVVEAAFHYAAAGDVSRAGELLFEQRHRLSAQGRAFAAAAVLDTLLHAAERRRIHPDLTRQLLSLRGDLLVGTSRVAEAEASYRAALQQTQQPAVRAQIAARLAECLVQRGQAEQALAVCTAARGALDAAHPLVLANLLAATTRAQLLMEDFDAALDAARAILDQIEPFDRATPAVAELRVHAHQAIATTLGYRQQPEAAVGELQRAIAAAHEGNLPHLARRCQIAMVAALVALGDLEGAIRVSVETMPLLEAAHDSYALAQLLLSAALSHLIRGELPEAFAAIERVCALAEDAGDGYTLVEAHIRRSRILMAMGRIREARSSIERMLMRPTASVGMHSRGYLLDRLAMAQLLQGDPQGAIATCARALALPAASSDGKLRAELQIHQALAFTLADDDAEAGRVLAGVALAQASPLTVLAYDLARAAVRLVRGDDPAELAGTLADLADLAASRQHILHANAARRLTRACANPPPRAALPYLLWVDAQLSF